MPLVACTEDHFAFSEATKEVYNTNGGSGWLCPPIGQKLTVDGKLLASNYEYFDILVKKCNTTLHSNCANETEMLARVGGQFRMGVMLVGNVINPDDQVYSEPSIESRNTFLFTTTSAQEIEGYIEDVIVNTDHSLWPIEDVIS